MIAWQIFYLFFTRGSDKLANPDLGN